ncbi:polysaccharide deacetylase family protein [Piscibacillus halophilus]|uniref:Peptidoglycan/xylan/chitin deacetylase, PgdA/CDA1 family n=1 Tax=Piscibacillus halophilus TaxID=571933 RepID=A0A1H9KUP1_9BACI|nr:polysaccharide deacetylase family protein [Piscibacillus halophilus]SER02912.1 Peptidoglycan/xylan/chitin deacetylase, PgdA/CDA1 family [Piscibacillus halophilus]
MKKILIVTSIAVILIISVVYLVNEFSKHRTFQLFGELVSDVETEEKVVALTFDDGPGVYTDQILDILRDHDVKGTFYLIGEEMENHFEDTKLIVEEGHEIGNHSYTHSRMIFKSYSFIQDEIEKTDELIREAGYEGDITFRPPYGRKLVMLPLYLSNQDREAIMWNIEPDTDPEMAKSPQMMAEHVAENIEPGSIILLHVMNEWRKDSLEAVEPIITSLKEEGYSFVTVSELLDIKKQ